MIQRDINSEEAMIEFGEELAKNLSFPSTIELIGDVGTGKTTITKGIAKGLGIKEEITSPSFTLSKRYNFGDKTLVHYDFYRLAEPGIMSEDLLENVSDQNTVVVVEWADSVAELLPEKHLKLEITLNDDGTRTIKELS